MKAQNTLILGIGNTLLSDEGAGIHAMQKLQSDYPELQNVTFVDGGTLSFTLAACLQDCTNVIVLDAAELHSPPGTVETLVGARMDEFLGAARRSPHEVGLLDLFDIARLTDSLPENRALVGIQPQSIEWGMAPTQPVEAALPLAVDEAVKLLIRWQAKQQPPSQGFHALLDKLVNADLSSGDTP